MKRRILITGGFGFLGGRLAQFLAENPEYEIDLGTRRLEKSPRWLPQASVVRVQWESPTNLGHICSSVDTIVHMAGMNAQDCFADPIAALEFNSVATSRLLQAAIRQGVKRFVYVSTAHVYGSPLSGVITEETCPVSLHPYATSHRAAEDVLRAAHQRGKIEGIVIRLSNTFGAPAHSEANCWMLLVNDLCRQAVMTGRMVLNSTGHQKRDFITLTDTCRATRHLMELPAERLGNGLFNVGGAWSPTIWDMALAIQESAAKIIGSDVPLSRLPGGEAKETSLNYRIEKIIRSGFALSAKPDNEIESLLKFCTSVRDQST